MLGESPGNTQTAMAGAIPVMLSGLINRAESSDGGNFLSGLLQQFTGGSNLPDPNDANDAQTQTLMTQGSSVSGALFGDKSSLISGALAQYAGVKESSASGLMGMAGSVLMGMLGRQASTGNLGPGGLMNLLGEQKNAVQSAMPSGLGSLLGGLPGIGGLFGGSSGLGSTLSGAEAGLAGAGAGVVGATAAVPNTDLPGSAAMESDATRSAGYAPRPVSRDDDERGGAAATSGGFGKLLPWVLLGLGALALFFMLRGCNRERAETAVTDSTTAVSDAASDVATDVGAATDSAASDVSDAASDVASDVSGAAANLGAFAKRKLSSGIELNIPANGIENKLISFIDDANRPVDKTTWFNFDRLLFETGSARLTASSQEQVRNIAEILKAYPNVNIKLGGYTDNQGNAASNKKLSNDRANTVRTALVNLGIAANRLEAEGYGQEFPVASNETAEGRAQNRRIAVRITKK